MCFNIASSSKIGAQDEKLKGENKFDSMILTILNMG